MTGPCVIASLDKNRRERLRVALDTWQGVNLLDLRVTVDLGSSGVQTATKKGVAMNVALIPQLRQALADAETQARDLGWLA
jgi:hypothetical protein